MVWVGDASGSMQHQTRMSPQSSRPSRFSSWCGCKQVRCGAVRCVVWLRFAGSMVLSCPVLSCPVEGDGLGWRAGLVAAMQARGGQGRAGKARGKGEDKELQCGE